MSTIEPCPFCGCDAAVEEVENAVGPTGSVAFSVGCNSRDEAACMGYQSLTTFARRSEAIEAWNRRAIDRRTLRILAEAIKAFAPDLANDLVKRWADAMAAQDARLESFLAILREERT